MLVSSLPPINYCQCCYYQRKNYHQRHENLWKSVTRFNPYTHKMSCFKRMSGLQKIRLQYVWFQNILTSKYFKTSGLKNVQYYIKITKKIQSKRFTQTFWWALEGTTSLQNYEEILVRLNAYVQHNVCYWPNLTQHYVMLGL